MATSERSAASAVLGWPPSVPRRSSPPSWRAPPPPGSPPRPPALTDATLLVYEAALCALAVALLVGPASWSRGRGRRSPTSSSICARRAPALCATRSPRRLAIPRSRSATGSIEATSTRTGRPLALPAEGSDRKVTRVDQDGEAIAVLVHDAAVLDDPGLSDALARAARLAAANARLQAEVRTQRRRAGRIAPAPGSRRRRGATPARAAAARDGRTAPDGAGGPARGRRGGTRRTPRT